MNKFHKLTIGGVAYLLLFAGHSNLQKRDTDDKCGGEARWEQKIMVDRDAWDVLLKPKTTTIAKLATLDTIKTKIGKSTERLAVERQVYLIKEVLITEAILQKDNDIHLVIEDGKGGTLLAEIPDPDCPQAKKSEFRDDFIASHEIFMQHQHTFTEFWWEISGVLFVDAKHSKSPLGNNPNNVELHPVLSLKKVKRFKPAGL